MVARSCRTCHVAFRPELTWSTWDQFKGEEDFGNISYITSRGEMPHAVITKMNMYSQEKAHWPDEDGPRVLACFIKHIDDEAKMQECIANP